MLLGDAVRDATMAMKENYNKNELIEPTRDDFFDRHQKFENELGWRASASYHFH